MFNCIVWIFDIYEKMKVKDESKNRIIWIIGDEDILEVPRNN